MKGMVFYVQTKTADRVIAAFINAVNYLLRRYRHKFTDRNRHFDRHRRRKHNRSIRFGLSYYGDNDFGGDTFTIYNVKKNLWDMICVIQPDELTARLSTTRFIIATSLSSRS